MSEIFKFEFCAECKNCCVFEEKSFWEFPTFSKKSIDRLNEVKDVIPLDGGRFRISLAKGCGAQPCPFLDDKSGCTLPSEEKPFACKLWPVRVMKDDSGKLVLTLYKGCKALPESSISQLIEQLENGLKDEIYAEISADPSLITPYHPSYHVLDVNF